MTLEQCLTISGLVLDIFGIFLLFKYGDISSKFASDKLAWGTGIQLPWWKKYSGLVLLTIGFSLQIAGSAVSGKALEDLVSTKLYCYESQSTNLKQP